MARAGRSLSALDPVKRASRAVSLEVTGSFFALFAFSFALGAWRFAQQIRSSGQGPHRFAACCVVAVIFAWFAISNFARAKRL